ncbi:FKBP-type peptidyl-prolyl cis-trans isomerase [Psychroserpens ponticola]|uniref:Peptidyl-prolyl cis-trans isomerase n=1 Tax=Psychroserpens ponticola TaxID=2932268 RepID=A0ABY7RV19_9FLAO|nr:FKBP-type peptidyl-prolyl cis-trans isomerase [Psychroserpens ponticola]WCO00769.1 FKBP-type peptidyl-prolyl cis-trans isomerase [Psychroserpens ponticola]
MKKSALLVIITLLLTSCGNDKKHNHNRNIVLNDTITTPSGLKYIFIKEGFGQKIEDGSKVKAFTELYINDNPEIFWSTAGEKDSVFAFIHGKTTLIKGFTELNSYLAEGDKVIAILPDSLAYGNKVKNGVPVGSTLIYSPYEVRYASKAKELLEDTLYNIASTVNSKAAIDFYETILNSDLKDKYHTDVEDLAELLLNLNKATLYKESEDLASYFLQKTDEDNMKQSFSFYKLLALESQGKFDEALNLVKPLATQVTNQEWWHNKMLELKTKVANDSIN